MRVRARNVAAILDYVLRNNHLRTVSHILGFLRRTTTHDIMALSCDYITSIVSLYIRVMRRINCPTAMTRNGRHRDDNYVRSRNLCEYFSRPFPPSPPTFLGSIMGNFVASMYSNGNSPLGFAQSLLGMFGSSMSGILKGNSAYAADATTAYASSCTDSDITSASIAADPFCNPIYGLSNSDTLSLEDTVDRITDDDWGDCEVNGAADSDHTDKGSCDGYTDSNGNKGSWKSAIDSSAKNYDKNYGLNTDAAIPDSPAGKTVGNFLDECVTRNNSGSYTPMGTAGDNGMGNGKNCALTDSSSYGRANLVTLYNYAEYFLANSNINQGSALGSQADGSATD